MNQPYPRERSRLRCFLAALVSGLILITANAHEAWRPWLGGHVTADWARVLWVINLGAGAHVAANLLLLVTCPPLLRRVCEFFFAVTALITVAVLSAVFPFEGITVLMRVVLLFGFVAASVHLIKKLFKLTLGGTKPNPVHH